MGLLKIIRKLRQKERELRLLILGLDGAGKTTIVKKLCNEDITDISPTYGFDIKTLEYNHYKLNIWDIGGQVSIRSYWRNYFEETEGLVWVIDSFDVKRIDDCARELHNVLQQEKLAGASLLVFVNKQDLGGSLPIERVVERLGLKGEAYANRHWSVLPCSAVTGAGLSEGFDWLVDDITGRLLILE